MAKSYSVDDPKESNESGDWYAKYSHSLNESVITANLVEGDLVAFDGHWRMVYFLKVSKDVWCVGLGVNDNPEDRTMHRVTCARDRVWRLGARAMIPDGVSQLFDLRNHLSNNQ